MIKNYLVIALRYILRYKVFTFINISGLTLGLTCSLLIILYVQDELSYDRFHPDAQSIFRLALYGTIQGKQIHSVYSASPLAKTLVNEPSEVRSAVRLVPWATFPIRYEDKVFTEDYLLLADSNFFRFFNFPLVHGHPDSVLNEEAKLVISESTARRYFNYQGSGDTSPIGKTMVLAQGYLATVSGIAKDPPHQSHLHFTHVLSLASWDEANTTNWIDRRIITYIKLYNNTDPMVVSGNINQIFTERYQQEIQGHTHVDTTSAIADGTEIQFVAQPLTDIHLKSDLEDEIEQNGNIQHIYVFSTIALFITLLACINFMNLFTARSVGRSKEVGVRKAAGAQNIRLIGQFLLESYLYVIVSVIISLFIILVMLGPFNFFTEKNISFSTLLNPSFVTGTVLFVIATGLLAGSYPAFYLTRFNPVEVLRGTLRARLRSYGIRNIMVIFQFFVSSGLIVATIVVYHQLTFINQIDLGFDKSHVINLLHTKNLGDNGKAFKEELLNQPGIIATSYSSRLPPNINWQYIFHPEGSTKDFMLHVYEMDYDHLQTMGYTLVKGRFFSKENSSDSLAILLNETAARAMGLHNEVGARLFSYYDTPGGRMRHVIGIVKDFNFQSLKTPVQPLAIVLGPEPNWEIAVRVSAGDVDKKIELVHSLFKKYAPNAPFEYSWVDENFKATQVIERRIGFLFTIFTFLAIFIACLGLLGLATFTTEQRTKEIGIRKALGASETNIIALLNKDFLKLVLIANLLAWPVSWWFMHLWLQQFAYHITIKWWVFILALFVTSAIAVLSVSLQALQAATGNPVKSLRNE